MGFIKSRLYSGNLSCVFRQLSTVFLMGMLCLSSLSSASFSAAYAQPPAPADGASARLRVDSAGVEVKRINTDNWRSIRVETLVGAGDIIRTDSTGRATIVFSKGLLSLQLFSSGEVVLTDLKGADNMITLDMEMRQGVATYRMNDRSANKTIEYRVNTPAFTAKVNRGDADFRVESSGRSAAISWTAAMTVTPLTGDEASPAQVLPKTGIRSGVDGPLSDVVPASSFATLDSALDGCPGIVTVSGGDVRLNVRLGGALKFKRIGALDNHDKIQVMGIARAGSWFRIQYNGGYGWINTPGVSLDLGCAGLRVFPDGYGPEDEARFTGAPIP